MRILIVDDNQMVRHGVKLILSAIADYQICGEAQDGEEAVRLANELTPDVILLDVSMPGQDGLQVARQIRQSLPMVKIIIMSQHDPTFLLPRALEAGAQACVDKNNLDPGLLAAIQTTQRQSSAS